MIASPIAGPANKRVLKGEGGLHNPSDIARESLSQKTAHYKTPVAVMQFNQALEPKEQTRLRFLFGPAATESDISTAQTRHFTDDSVEQIDAKKGVLAQTTTDKAFDHFVNHWLTRQVRYHGEVKSTHHRPANEKLFARCHGNELYLPTDHQNGIDARDVAAT